MCKSRLLQFTTSNNMPVDSTRNPILLAALNRLDLTRAGLFVFFTVKHVTWKESHHGESFTEVMVCM